MATYLIGYDLNTPGKDYADLIDAIKALTDCWWHYLDSTWIIKHNGDARAICNKLNSHIDNNDELLVVELSGEGSWAGFNDKGSKWLFENL